MARTELPNGIILPAEYSDDWYDDMTSNLSKLDEVIGSDAEKLSEEDVGAAALSNDYTDLDNKPALKPVATSGDYDDLDNKPDLKPVATSGDYDDLDNKPDLKPVATSGDYDDLDNKPDLKPVATSGDYDDLTDLPTYGITRYCSSAITDNSSVAFSAISSTNKIKVGDFLLDTAGKMYQISSVDTANETVSVTTPLTQLAVDSGVIHNTGNETKSGELTLSDTLNSSDIVPRSNNTYDFGSVSNLLRNLYTYHGYFRGQQQNDEYSSNARTNLTLLANRDTLGQSGCLIDTFRSNTPQGTSMHILGFGIKENSIRYEGVRFQWVYDSVNSGYNFNLKPNTQGTNTPLTYNFGTSADKWDTINGINPGCLSLPDLNNGIDISGYLTPGNSDNAYTPLVDGFVSISIGIASGGCAVFLSQGDMYNACYSATGAPNASGVTAYCMLPVKGGVQMNIGLKGSNNYINSAKFYPCQGNV